MPQGNQVWDLARMCQKWHRRLNATFNLSSAIQHFFCMSGGGLKQRSVLSVYSAVSASPWLISSLRRLRSIYFVLQRTGLPTYKLVNPWAYYLQVGGCMPVSICGTPGTSAWKTRSDNISGVGTRIQEWKKFWVNQVLNLYPSQSIITGSSVSVR